MADLHFQPDRSVLQFTLFGRSVISEVLKSGSATQRSLLVLPAIYTLENSGGAELLLIKATDL
jgi:hypothetical protein